MIAVNIIEIIVLVITASVIVWYTLETKRLADLTARQIKINIKPIVVVVNIRNFCLLVKNIGRSPALEINVNPITIRDVTSSSDLEYQFVIDGTHYVAGDEQIQLGTDAYSNENVAKKFEKIRSSQQAAEKIQKHMMPSSLIGDENYMIEINYVDVEGGKWQSKFRVDKGGVNYLGIEDIKGE